MKKIQTISVLLMAVLLSSCYTSTTIDYKYQERVQRGMHPKEVIAILGEPSYRSFDEKGEVLEFRSSEYNPARVVKVRFVDDKVVEMKGYLDESKNCCNGTRVVKDKKEDESSKSEKSTTSKTKVRVTADGKHIVQTGSIIVTPDGKHETVVSDHGGVIVTASGEHIVVH